MAWITGKDVFQKIWKFGLCKSAFISFLLFLILFITIRCTVYLSGVQRVTHAAVGPGFLDTTPPPASKSGTVDIGFPRVIHQIWFQSKEIGDEWKPAVQSCHDQNPNYEFRLWTHVEMEEFLTKEYPWFMETYNSYTYRMQKIDATRLFILYHFGGVYMDVDIECPIPLDKILEYRTKYGVIITETTPWGVSNSIIVAKKRDPFIWYLVQGLKDSHLKWYVIKYATVIFSTGPMMVTDRLYTWNKPETVQVIDLKERDEVFVNLHAGTWHSWDGVIIYGFSKHYKLILVMAGVVVSLFVLHKIYRQRQKLKRDARYLTEKQKLELGLTSA